MRHLLKPIIIRGYIAASARVFIMCYIPDCTKDVSVQSLLTNFDLECPRNDHRLFLRWDIHVVLEYLQSDDQCDLQNMSLMDLARKTMFLIALATAFRVSELHALSRSPTCLRWNQDGSVTLQTFLGFVVKNKRASCAGQRVQPLTDNPKLSLVTYWRGFLHFTADTSSDQLFQPFRAGTNKTTPQLIAKCLRKWSVWPTRVRVLEWWIPTVSMSVVMSICFVFF